MDITPYLELKPAPRAIFDTLPERKTRARFMLPTPDGGVWIVYPKGRKDIREADVMAAGRDLGLKDNKTCRFSDTHTGLRFVIPVAERQKPKSRG